MLTRGIRLRVLAFLVIGLLVVVYVGLNYAKLGRLVGLRGYYVVTMQLNGSGGIFTNAEVTYRGVSVGRVGALALTDQGVDVQLDIDNSAPHIPVGSKAVVANRSAVGEQYVDLRPDTTKGPFLGDGSVIPVEDTKIPLAVQDLLTSVDRLASSVPTESLRTVVDELGTAMQGAGPNLQALLDNGSSFVQVAAQHVPQTQQLITDSQTVLHTQQAEGDALRTFADNAALLSAQFKQSDPDLRRLISAGTDAAAQTRALVRDLDPNMGVLFANLLTTANVMRIRQNGLEQLLVSMPRAIDTGSKVITQNGANLALELTFFDPLPCTTGYGGTTYRNGLDTSPGTLNTQAACTLPAGSATGVRGSQNAPYGGGVPPAATPGAPLPWDLARSGATGTPSVSRLLGLPN
ncbi:MCE family protein [Kutzneria albida]|uniref:Uncharacterized protein n=1 Tax=Kutzneria albida DSM 43870 TaxID=1449976 RepID=W5WGQ5_9PSEU|nr:MlaD family protein [Kutzneria albida]AHH99761.1 hypothetical protein KALB_6401 [Kutzneria albida DSM 43870]